MFRPVDRQLLDVSDCSSYQRNESGERHQPCRLTHGDWTVLLRVQVTALLRLVELTADRPCTGGPDHRRPPTSTVPVGFRRQQGGTRCPFRGGRARPASQTGCPRPGARRSSERRAPDESSGCDASCDHTAARAGWLPRRGTSATAVDQRSATSGSRAWPRATELAGPGPHDDRPLPTLGHAEVRALSTHQSTRYSRPLARLRNR